MSIGLCLGEFAPLHQGHLDLIMRAKKENDLCIVAVCGFDGDARAAELGLNLKQRTQLVREFFQGDHHIQVVSVDDTLLGIDESMSEENWRIWFAEMRRQAGCPTGPIVSYVAEPLYAERLNAIGEHPMLMEKENRVSGSEIRRNPLKYWNKIASSFRPFLTRNILIVGTASEGKTTLVNDLSRYFGIPRAEEWGRVYMETHALRDEELTVDHFVEFLTGQVRLCQEAIQQASQGIMLADTDNLITLMYAKSYALDPNINMTMDDYQQVLYPLAWAMRDRIRWDRIFVLQPGGDYVDDGLRYMGQSEMSERMKNHEILMSLLHDFGLDDRVVMLRGGDYLNNFLTVKNYIDGLLAQ